MIFSLQFLVMDNEESRENDHCKEQNSLYLDAEEYDDYWEKRYSIDIENVPVFLKSHADIILRTGKYLNVIRDSGKFASRKNNFITDNFNF